jgi:hypothetical protein
LTEFATGFGEDVGGNLRLPNGEKFAYIDGSCEIPLPAGTLVVEASKGPEYLPLKETVELPAGKLALRLELRRWADSRQQGWYAGDTQAHFLTPHGALLEAAAEDLAFVNLLAFELKRDKNDAVHPGLSNILSFSGQQPLLEVPGHCVVVNTWNRSEILNSLALLNCHRIVFPLTIGRQLDRHLWALGDWTLADWCDQCHRKGGLAIWTDVGLSSDHQICEAVAEVILGRIDALQVTALNWCPRGHWEWYTLLNGGCRIPMVCGSNKDCNETPLGIVRTYARLSPEEKPTYPQWIDAVRAGRTFVTSGPLLEFTVNGQGPGAVLLLTDDSPTVRFQAQAWCASPFQTLEVVYNGEVVATAAATGHPCAASLEGELDASSGGWLAARCWGDRHPPLTLHFRHGAHTSPVYVQSKTRCFRSSEVSKRELFEALDGSIALLDRIVRFENCHQRDRLASVFFAAKAELARRAQAE